MPFYKQMGSIPRKRHTEHRAQPGYRNDDEENGCDRGRGEECDGSATAERLIFDEGEHGHFQHFGNVGDQLCRPLLLDVAFETIGVSQQRPRPAGVPLSRTIPNDVSGLKFTHDSPKAGALLLPDRSGWSWRRHRLDPWRY